MSTEGELLEVSEDELVSLDLYHLPMLNGVSAPWAMMGRRAFGHDRGNSAEDRGVVVISPADTSTVFRESEKRISHFTAHKLLFYFIIIIIIILEAT